MTKSTTFTISPDGAGTGASCTATHCRATTAGTYTVTGTDGSVTGSAILTVTAGPTASLSLSPSTSIAAAGVAQLYGAEGFDTYSNDAGDQTASTTFTVAPKTSGSSVGASCSANSCSATAVAPTP